MLEAIEKLLILQDRDRKILKLREELAHVPHEKKGIQAKFDAAHQGLEVARHSLQKLESERKELELQVEGKKQQIEKYSVQQFQTKKNEEYRALANEIENCKAHIRRIEDQQLELMEKAEAANKQMQTAKAADAEAKKNCDSRLADLDAREASLKRDLAQLESNREELAAAVDDSTRSRYERLLKSKGNNVVVGVNHGVCGGCHMQLSRQVVVTCQAEQELINCPNCGRILYYSSDMDVATAS